MSRFIELLVILAICISCVPKPERFSRRTATPCMSPEVRNQLASDYDYRVDGRTQGALCKPLQGLFLSKEAAIVGLTEPEVIAPIIAGLIGLIYFVNRTPADAHTKLSKLYKDVNFNGLEGEVNLLLKKENLDKDLKRLTEIRGHLLEIGRNHLKKNDGPSWLLNHDVFNLITRMAEATQGKVAYVSPDESRYLYALYESNLDRKGASPLVNFEDVHKALKKLGGQDQLSAKNVKDILEEDIFIHRSTGTVLAHYQTSSGIAPRRFNKILKWLSKKMGEKFDKELKPRDRRIMMAEVAAQLRIPPAYRLPFVGSDGKGNWAFWGFDHAYKSKLEDFSTLNEFFTRELKDIHAKALRAQLTKDANLSVEGGQIFHAMADSALRYFRVKKGEIHVPFSIVGKVLNQEAAKIAKKAESGPFYNQKTYQAKIENMFGRDGERRVPMLLAAEGKRVVIDEKATSRIHELMDLYMGYLNQKEQSILVQRLDANDNHTYSLGIDGEFMGLGSVVEFLIKNKAAFDKLDAGKIEGLKSFFDSRKDLAKIDQIGFLDTNFSVATPAIVNRPEILFSNDHWLGFQKIGDGEIALHSFVGATAVNRVDVRTDGKKLGDPLGKMAFGKFDIRGSTIISVLPERFHPVEPLDQWFKVKYDKEKSSQRSGVEVHVQQGQPTLRSK